MDELEELAIDQASQNGTPIENVREEARIMDAPAALKPVIPEIEKTYLSPKYPQEKLCKLGHLQSKLSLIYPLNKSFSCTHCPHFSSKHASRHSLQHFSNSLQN